MIGYKALNKNMRSTYGNMTYEMNKEYEIEGKLVSHSNGYHFCKELVHVYRCYLHSSRVFEIDTLDGDITNIDDSVTYASSKIKLIRELSYDEIKEYLKEYLDSSGDIMNDAFSIKRTLAYYGLGLDKLINDEDPYIRASVAEQGYGLDKLANDPDDLVRGMVECVKSQMLQEANNDRI